MAPMGGPPPAGGRNNMPMRGPGPVNTQEEIDLARLAGRCDEMMQIRYLEPADCEFAEKDSGFIQLKIDGKLYAHVDVYRVFPYTNPAEYLSVRDAEDAFREIGIIRQLSAFPEETGRLIERHLKLRYFTPEIKEILFVRRRAGVVTMKVRTEYGECRFAFRNNSNAVIRLGENRVFIQDMDENRYQIPDVTKLTIREQKKLDALL